MTKQENINQNIVLKNIINLSGMIIAVLDTDNSLNELINILNSFNVNLVFARNIIELNQIISNQNIELIILNSELDDFNTTNLIKIKNINKEYPIPIAVIDNFLVQKSFEPQKYIDFFIEKPFNKDLILRQIYQVYNVYRNYKEINLKRQHFIAALTHDLKNPVNAEISALEMLSQNRFGNMNQKQKIIIESILNSAKYMKHITDQILCFYKYNNNSITLDKQEVILDKVILDAVDTIKFVLEEKKQKIEINNNIKNLLANIDEIEIKRVIHNLITNASEYSNTESKIIINMNFYKSNFVIEVQDFGCGIDANNLENIFDEYLTLAKTQKRVGFGLGLNICKHIILAHNGEITINSALGIGTTVRFTIPGIVL